MTPPTSGLSGVQQIVPLALVHKRSPDNVLLTDAASAGADRFLCEARIPAAHGFFYDGPRTPSNDIMFYTEVGRQASLAISHLFLEVKQDDIFIFEASAASIGTCPAPPSVTPEFEPVRIEVAIRELHRRRTAVSRVVADYRMSYAGAHVFTGTGAWSLQPAAVFQRLRQTGARRSASGWPIRDAVGGQSSANPNVVIELVPCDRRAGEAAAARLVVDESHPYFFDHPCDHVPGMLILEACAQLAVATPGVRGGSRRPFVCAYDATFGRFVERNTPATVTARFEGSDSSGGVEVSTVAVDIAQDGTLAGTARLRVTAGA